MPKKAIVPEEQALSNTLRILPISGRPIFPGIFTPLMINSQEDVKVVEEAYAADGHIGIVLVKQDSENPAYDNLYEVGTLAKIIKKINLPDGGVNIFISTIKRFKMLDVLNPRNPITASVQYFDDVEENSFKVKALTRTLVTEMKEIADNNPLFTEEMRLNMVNIEQPGKIADFVASILNIEKEDQQRILEIRDIPRRMETVLVFIKKEQELLRVQKKIQVELNNKIEKNQRDYFLREELKTIQEELGIASDSKSSDYLKFEKALANLNLEGEVLESVQNELEKFKLMDPHSSDFMITRTFLDTIIKLPWNDENPENYTLAKAKEILNNDHYGLDDVKERMIEYLAVRKLKNDSKGSIILLVGPPGVGKTSVGHSIAKAMNKPFYRFSVGGMRDEAEIKGHRRTYVGAMPGKIIQGLKTVKSKSPVFMIDEIDKMGSSNQGDPSSALLEVLDPEQNKNFRDHYLDVPFDVSNILFILTANSLKGIPAPLRDRAEIITLSGYIDAEKVAIAKNYLVPKSLEKNGLSKNQVKYDNKTLLYIANSYAREAGVRNLEKHLDKIHRKYATELLLNSDTEKAIDELLSMQLERLTEKIEFESAVEELSKLVNSDIKSDLVTVMPGFTTHIEKKATTKSKEEKAKQKEVKALLKTSFTPKIEDITKYLGKPIFDDEINKVVADIPGTAIGLAWTSMGGDTLLLEAISMPGRDGLRLTGQMGDVMKESATIAMAWTRAYVLKNKIKKLEYFTKNTIHLHIPEGATPKDGPSAGITMVTTFLSLIKNKKIKKNIAMTGELSLTGKVLAIGGLKEKTVAAKRNGIKEIIIPKANVRDLDDIPEHVKKGITFHPVSKIEEVLEIVF